MAGVRFPAIVYGAQGFHNPSHGAGGRCRTESFMNAVPSSSSSPAGTVLVLGGRGRFGLAAVQAFARDGWRVLAQMRPGAQAPTVAGVQWLAQAVDTPQAVT